MCRYDQPGFSFSFEPNTAVQLRHHFGLTNALAIDVANACAGLFTGISIVDMLINLGVIRSGLVVTGDYISHITATAQKEIEGFTDPRLACLTLGDAAAAILLERSDASSDAGFEEMDLYTLGSHSHLCVAKPSDRTPGAAIMLTDSAAMSAVGIGHSVAHIDRTLKQAGWTISDVDHLIPHQTSRSTLRRARSELEDWFGSEVNLVDNLTNRGNTGTSTQMIAIWDGIMEGRIGNGDRVAFAVAGSGLTIGTALYTFDDLPDRLRRSTIAGDPARGRAPRFEERSDPNPPTAQRVRIREIGLACPPDRGCVDSLDLAARAAATCIAGTPYQPDDIDVLIYTGVYRSDFVLEPAIATILAGRLGCNAANEPHETRHTFAFDLFNGGMGFLNGCYLATEFIRANPGTTCMVVTAEVENNRGVGAEMRGIREVGSAVILESAGEDNDGLGAMSFRYFPNFLDALTVRTEVREQKICLAIESDPRYEEFLLSCVRTSVHDLLDSEGIDRETIRAVLSPVSSPCFAARLARCLGIDPDRVVNVHPSSAGDLFTSLLPFGLKAMRDREIVAPGDLGLLINVAAGIQVGCALYTF
jgi:3-oxoacyl-[acyl-carrier-protein] synthase III